MTRGSTLEYTEADEASDHRPAAAALASLRRATRLKYY